MLFSSKKNRNNYIIVDKQALELRVYDGDNLMAVYPVCVGKNLCQKKRTLIRLGLLTMKYSIIMTNTYLPFGRYRESPEIITILYSEFYSCLTKEAYDLIPVN